ncbi:hypothetical protein SAMN05661012_04484 [Chitinophaga sancti]|uniref:Uncharacterized protein n=1 Tax=Chitinophaga sancti TaxID=1004 RepID=A0A1K1RZF9_9BACT|nr:hypothetical protein SAMN05661012_04484 [Chitinophaga sancti]
MNKRIYKNRPSDYNQEGGFLMAESFHNYTNSIWLDSFMFQRHWLPKLPSKGLKNSVLQ